MTLFARHLFVRSRERKARLPVMIKRNLFEAVFIVTGITQYEMGDGV